MKLLLGVALLLALSGPAWAIPTNIPFEKAYNGPVVLDIYNWDNGTVYSNQLTNNRGSAQVGVLYNASDLVVASPIVGPSGVGDGWGIVTVAGIVKGTVSNGVISPVLGSSGKLYESGDAGTAIMGVFWGRQDDKVIFNNDGSQTIYADPAGSSEHVNLYVVPESSLDNWNLGMSGPAGSPSAGLYTGITDVGTLVLSGTVVTNSYSNGGGGNDGVFSTFNPAGGVNCGSFEFYIDWTGGTDINTFGSPVGQGYFGGSTDAYLSGHDNGGNFGWLVQSYDPAYMNAVPEPVTMMSMVLGIGCLGRYIRRRK